MLDLGGFEAQLTAAAGGVGFRTGERVLVLVEAVRGRDVVLTRRGDDFVREFVRLEVPEVERGDVEVAAVARDDHRAKVAVRLRGDERGERSTEAVEAAVGAHGAHALELTAALGDVQLDVVPWHPDPVRAALDALSGAEVLDVEADLDTLLVRVPSDGVRQAVGARGSNARLAAKLAGWRELRVIAAEDELGAQSA